MWTIVHEPPRLTAWSVSLRGSPSDARAAVVPTSDEVQAWPPPIRARTEYGDSPSKNAPTISGWLASGLDSRNFASEGSKRSAMGNGRPSTPRAALSHSSDVGSRYGCPVFSESQSTYATASNQLTLSTGKSSSRARGTYFFA